VSLIRDGQIQTTLAKAKALQPRVERMVTLAKKNNVSAKRLVATRLGEPKASVINKLFTEIAPKFNNRNGGYTRIIKIGRSNGRDEAVISFVE
jgi:large subunit ribosomal protein L17